jgi:hypothetical protein
VKIRTVLSLAVAVVITNMAANSIANAEPLTNPAVRGQVAAILSFCARIYPPGRESYRGMERVLLGKGEREDRSEGSAEYREAFEAASDAIGKMAPDQALQTCMAAIKG